MRAVDAGVSAAVSVAEDMDAAEMAAVTAGLDAVRAVADKGRGRRTRITRTDKARSRRIAARLRKPT